MESYKINLKENFIEGVPGEQIIKGEGDILELMGYCYGPNIHKALIYDSNLAEEFFDLKSGFAGRILQKLANYHFKAAFVISEKYIRGRFAEMVKEARLKKEIGFFTGKEQAIKWLASI